MPNNDGDVYRGSNNEPANGTGDGDGGADYAFVNDTDDNNDDDDDDHHPAQ